MEPTPVETTPMETAPEESVPVESEPVGSFAPNYSNDDIKPYEGRSSSVKARYRKQENETSDIKS